MANIGTFTAQVSFHLEEQADGHFLVIFDQRHVPDIPVLARGFLQFDLEPGLTRAEADQVVDLLNRRVLSLAFTSEE